MCFLCKSNRQRLGDDTYAVGGATPFLLPLHVLRLANEYFDSIGSVSLSTETAMVQVFYRVMKGGNMLYSAKYGRVRNRNSYTVSYIGKTGERKFGAIQYFFSPNTAAVLVLLKVLVPRGGSLQHHFNTDDCSVDSLKFLVPVQESEVFDVTDLSKVVEKCLFIRVSNEDVYIAFFPHKLHD